MADRQCSDLNDNGSSAAPSTERKVIVITPEDKLEMSPNHRSPNQSSLAENNNERIISGGGHGHGRGYGRLVLLDAGSLTGVISAPSSPPTSLPPFPESFDPQRQPPMNGNSDTTENESGKGSTCTVLTGWVSPPLLLVAIIRPLAAAIRRMVGACERAGEWMASSLGITTPKYQYELDEYWERVRAARESDEERLEYVRAGWLQTDRNGGGGHEDAVLKQ